MKREVEKLTPVSALAPPPPGMTPIFSPQKTEAMLHLYANTCAKARCVFVSAPFALSPVLLEAFTGQPSGPALRFFLLDTEGSLGKGQAVHVIENDPANAIGIATTLPSALHDFQGRLLAGKEAFRHAGIHIHSKIILVDPFGTDPILIFGSANFSHASTVTNDSNSLVIRGDTAAMDAYVAEFMRMFETYHFRASVAHKLTQRAESDASGDKDIPPLGLKEDDSWSAPYFVEGSTKALDRMMFAGTLH